MSPNRRGPKNLFYKLLFQTKMGDKQTNNYGVDIFVSNRGKQKVVFSPRSINNIIKHKDILYFTKLQLFSKIKTLQFKNRF